MLSHRKPLEWGSFEVSVPQGQITTTEIMENNRNVFTLNNIHFMIFLFVMIPQIP